VAQQRPAIEDTDEERKRGSSAVCQHICTSTRTVLRDRFDIDRARTLIRFLA
jgi:hypothetical protein